MDKLRKEYDDLRAGGYSGEGFYSEGRRLGQGVSHNLSPAEARRKALEQAETRAQIERIMGPAGGRRLGGSGPSTIKPVGAIRDVIARVSSFFTYS